MLNESYRALLTWGRQQLEVSGIPESELDAWYLFSYAFKLDRMFYLLHAEEENADQMAKNIYTDMIHRRSLGEPVQYIIGSTEFMGLTFHVDSRVLIPRQDTEVLVETALEHLKEDATVLDMCTGSGCIILSLAHHGKLRAGLGVDLSEDALTVATMNRDCLELKQVDFLKSNLFENVKGCYDMIVSNPPYIRTEEINGLMREVKEHEPMMALDGMEDGLYFYREIIAKASQYLISGGWLLFEIGFDQAADVTALFEQAGYEQIQVKKDLAGLDRIVYAKKM